MGLIARELESRGIATLSMSSALSITRSVNPARGVFLDFPLGRTAGKPNAPDLNQEIMRLTLQAFEQIQTSGEVLRLPFEWDEQQAWKDRLLNPQASKSTAKTKRQGEKDDRVERFAIPQYQHPEDKLAYEQLGQCSSCIFLDESA